MPGRCGPAAPGPTDIVDRALKELIAVGRMPVEPACAPFRDGDDVSPNGQRIGVLMAERQDRQSPPGPHRSLTPTMVTSADTSRGSSALPIEQTVAATEGWRRSGRQTVITTAASRGIDGRAETPIDGPEMLHAWRPAAASSCGRARVIDQAGQSPLVAISADSSRPAALLISRQRCRRAADRQALVSQGGRKEPPRLRSAGLTPERYLAPAPP